MRALRRWGHTTRSDGGITSLQVLIMFPIMAIIFGMAMQMALNYYAKQVALAAAQEGVNAVRFGGLAGKTDADLSTEANAAVNAYLAKHGGSMLTGVTVIPKHLPPDDVITYTDHYVVRVRGQALSLLPLLAGSEDQTVLASIESFTNGLG